MSGFCVFGVTKALARKRAEDKVPAVDAKTKQELTKDEWTERVEAEAARIFQTAKPVKISPAFDAPQFCRDWIDVGLRTMQVRAPKVMARGKKLDASGNPLLNKKTGEPVMGWVVHT
jgi:hypothetical protein